jgi:hypothetical protein
VTGLYVAIASFVASLTERDEDGQGLAEYALAAGLVAGLAAALLALAAQTLGALNRAIEVMLNA